MKGFLKFAGVIEFDYSKSYTSVNKKEDIDNS